MRFVIFPRHLCKLRMPRKSEARSSEMLRLSRKIILPNLKAGQNATPLATPTSVPMLRRFAQLT